MDQQKQVETFAEYLELFPPEVQEILNNIKNLVLEVAPEATEMITYKMPTFELNKNRVYFAAFKNHIGFYAIYDNSDMESEFSKYRTTKDTLQFKLNEEIPYDVIKKVIKHKLD
jgi:uncharacterized protein YdhG (YjbR/CyaY superfamily)